MVESMFSWPLPAVRGLLAVAVILFFATVLDDLLVDFIYGLRRLLRRLRRRDEDGRVNVEDLHAVPEKPVAILVPAWEASESILRMLLHTVAVLDYRKYHIFVGVYPNDEATRFEVEKAREVHPNIDVVVMPHDGPTNDADCVNWLYHGVRVFEKDFGARFDLIVIHGPCDVVHPLSLKWFNRTMSRAECVQAPVFPFATPGAGVTTGVLMDAYAEEYAHLYRARKLLTGTFPTAITGLALDRRAADERVRGHRGRIFDPAAAAPGCLPGMCLYAFEDGKGTANVWLPAAPPVRRRAGPPPSREPVATRRAVPASFGGAVRAAADRLTEAAAGGRRRRSGPWSMTAVYFFLRGWKRPTAALATALAVPVALYAALALLTRAAGVSGVPPLWAAGGLTVPLSATLAALLAWRATSRALASASVYGWRQGVLAVPRLAVDAAIAVCALPRALHRLARARGRARPRCERPFPSEAQLRRYHRRLGDLLLERRFISVDDLQTALARQEETGRRLGDLLVSMGALHEADLINVLAEQGRGGGADIACRAASPELLALVPERVAREFRVFPLRTEGDTLLLATDALIAAARREELAAEIGRPVELQWCAARDVDSALHQAYDCPAGPGPSPARVLADRLVDAGTISEEVLDEALRQQSRTNRQLGEVLVAMGVITVSDLSVALSEAA